ncbi:MAG: hypothetical protein S4CHLAM20_12340 [Chlamydiia bacterium]|nr:hypothetical protein [Chlamydiia bacterium]
MSSVSLLDTDFGGLYPTHTLGIHLKAALVKSGFNYQVAELFAKVIQDYFANKPVRSSDGKMMASEIANRFNCLDPQGPFRQIALDGSIQKGTESIKEAFENVLNRYAHRDLQNPERSLSPIDINYSTKHK